MSYFAQSSDEVLSALKVDRERGLSSTEAEHRLHQFGPNELKEEKEMSSLQILLEQFKSPLVWILIAAALISLFVEEYVDAIVIAIIIMVNAAIGFFQEYRAERAIEALKALAAPQAVVLREGMRRQIPSRQLVAGDIILISEGDKIPADSRLLEQHSLETQEASLTGESLPVSKITTALAKKTLVADRVNMLFSGTVVVKGRGEAVVTATGMNSEFGKIARLVQQAKSEPTPLQKQLKRLATIIGASVLAVAIFVFLVGSLREYFLGAFGAGTLQRMFLIAVALAVAAIPEGLPAVVTISLSVGVKRMAKRNALIRKLPSVEGLGSVTVICSDKTGTLTHNEMTVRKIWMGTKTYDITGSGYSTKGVFSLDKKLIDPKPLTMLLTIGALCNDSSLQTEEGKVLGDPTEASLLVSAAKAGIIKEKLALKYPRIEEIPFSSERKLMTTIHSMGDKKLSMTKGALDVILDRCDRILINGKHQRLNRSMKKEILDSNELFASQALRVLGFAYNDQFSSMSESEVEDNMVFVGIQGMIDPPRQESAESIKRCAKAGIRVVMITGDHKTTAVAIAKELGIIGKAVTGAELKELSLDNEVEHVSIYARVNPADKLKIVEALQKKGHVVAMTGDGVNDAPALKQADIGIAMGITGTDVSKEASDMILTDDNFSSIVNAVEEGRTIYDNIKKFVFYLLSSNMGEVLTIFISIIIGLPLPLIAVQILWINLITDGAPATALGMEPAEEGIMTRKPRKRGQHIIDKRGFVWMLIIGLIMTVGTLGVFYWALRGGGWQWGAIISEGAAPHYYLYATTLAFTTLMMFQMFNVLNMKELRTSVLNKSIISNKWLLGAIALSMILQLLVVYVPILNTAFSTVPLSIADWVFAALISSSVLWAGEILKRFYHGNN